MEAIYNGRAIFEDTFQCTKITIPAKKNLLLMVFFSFWLYGWVDGELSGLGSLLGVGNGMGDVNFFLLFWLVGWSLAGFVISNILIWYLIGKEIITIGNGEISIEKKGLLFFKKKVTI